MQNAIIIILKLEWSKLSVYDDTTDIWQFAEKQKKPLPTRSKRQQYLDLYIIMLQVFSDYFKVNILIQQNWQKFFMLAKVYIKTRRFDPLAYLKLL